MNERTVEHFYKNGWRKLTVVHISEVKQELNKKDCQISKLERRIKELEAENERLKGEVRKWKRDSAITSAMFRLVVQGKECTSTKELKETK